MSSLINNNINITDKIVHNIKFLSNINKKDDVEYNFYNMILRKYKYLSKIYIKNINDYIFTKLNNFEFYQ